MRQVFDGLPKLVMFDLDGTLVDSVPDLAAAVDAMLLEQQYARAGEEKTRLWVGNGASTLVRRALADVDGIDESQVDEALHQYSLERFLHHYRRASGRHCKLYPGVKDALERLRQAGVRLALVTNKPSEFVPHLLTDIGIEQMFDAWLGGDSLEHKKPHPAPLLHLLQQYQTSAAQSLMVGDSRSDISAAKAARVATLGVSYGYNHGKPITDESPTWVCSNLDDFFAVALTAASTVLPNDA